jgi:uncharacterized protein (TIGR00369 family)
MPTDDDTGQPVPGGFTRTQRGGAYFNQLGPVYSRADERGGIVLALRVAPRHANLRGIGHGGMLATLADGALGANVSIARGRRGGQVTVSLSADFLSAAHQGDWLEAHVEVRRVGAKLAFADCILKVGERQVLRSSGVFALLETPPPEPLPAPDAAAASPAADQDFDG